ncbi:MAG: class I SAM-dependent methyltransferase [Candidatus Sungbacteria bacterium]|nr:class I SAM-dependent methyltransferase [Candidatus Sungbacteria bacterium]
MRADLYETFCAKETTHWWFVARRNILQSLIGRYIPMKVQTALDIGSGPGINIPLIRTYAKKITCLEASDTAVAMAQRKFPDLTIVSGSFPQTVPGGNFDLITMFDVLEHIEEHAEALQTVRSLLKTGGYLMLTVPAFMFLWSAHDDHVHHKRRYTRRQICSLLADAGFRIERATYFNTLLFPAIAGVRLFQRTLKIRTTKTDFDMEPPRWLNSVLTRIFGSERFMLHYGNLPVGVSIFCVAKK